MLIGLIELNGVSWRTARVTVREKLEVLQGVTKCYRPIRNETDWLTGQGKSEFRMTRRREDAMAGRRMAEELRNPTKRLDTNFTNFHEPGDVAAEKRTVV